MRVAISGAGIAGTVLAYWLLKAGHEPVLIEEAGALRTGGYVVDFWGLGYAIAERMGLSAELDARGLRQTEVRFVDNVNRRISGFSTRVMRDVTGGRFTTISRGALVEMFFATVRDRAETIFGNRIVALGERPDGVTVGLASGRALEVDIVVGADGLHSGVRALGFGPEAGFERFMGYDVAAFELQGYRPRDERVYVIHATAAHQVARLALPDDRTLILLISAAESGSERPRTLDQRRAALRDRFGAMGWELPQILEGMRNAGEIYYDRMSQIRMPRWTTGRVALIGDAAAAVSLLAGEGTGLAMVGAYVLAGELARAGSDHARAFAEYERHLRPFITAKQTAAERFAATFAVGRGPVAAQPGDTDDRHSRPGPPAPWPHPEGRFQAAGLRVR